MSFDNAKYQNKEALDIFIDEMKANDHPRAPTRTDQALEMVAEEVFKTANGDRPESPNIMIIFIDGGTHRTSKPYDLILPKPEVSSEKHVKTVMVQ